MATSGALVSTQALATVSNYLNALRDDLVSAIVNSEATKDLDMSSTALPSTKARSDVGAVFRQLSQLSELLLIASADTVGAQAAANPAVMEVPPQQAEKPSRNATVPDAVMRKSSQVVAYTAPIEVFEGTVRSVDRSARMMYVTLASKTRDVSDHAADISFDWVNPQDIDLIAPGAVFYLSLYRERRGRTIRNTEELRFRRMPEWSRVQIERVRGDADRLFSKLQVRPILEE